jgi:hypothetical protein
MLRSNSDKHIYVVCGALSALFDADSAVVYGQVTDEATVMTTKGQIFCIPC